MSRSESDIWRDGKHLYIALKCMKASTPLFWGDVVAKVHSSRWERRSILRNLRAHPFYRMICGLEGIKP